MSRERAAGWLLQKRLMMIAAGMLAGAALVVALQPVFPVSGAASNAVEAQLLDRGTGVVFQVHPTIVRFPASRIRNHGVWLIAAGLEADQEVKIRMVWGIAGLETDITSVIADIDEERGGVFANLHGAFAVGFERGFRGVEGDFLFYGEYLPVSLRLHDAITDELLAVAPMVVCGPDLEQRYCTTASDVVSIR